MLDINPEKVRQVITEARMLDMKEDVTDSAFDPDEFNDAGAETLENPERDAVYEELWEAAAPQRMKALGQTEKTQRTNGLASQHPHFPPPGYEAHLEAALIWRKAANGRCNRHQ